MEEGRRRQLAGATLTTDRYAPFNAPFYETLGFKLLEDEAIPLHLQLNLESQVRNGLDPRRRIAMVRQF